MSTSKQTTLAKAIVENVKICGSFDSIRNDLLLEFKNSETGKDFCSHVSNLAASTITTREHQIKKHQLLVSHIESSAQFKKLFAKVLSPAFLRSLKFEALVTLAVQDSLATVLAQKKLDDDALIAAEKSQAPLLPAQLLTPMGPSSLKRGPPKRMESMISVIDDFMGKRAANNSVSKSSTTIITTESSPALKLIDDTSANIASTLKPITPPLPS